MTDQEILVALTAAILSNPNQYPVSTDEVGAVRSAVSALKAMKLLTLSTTGTS